MSLDFLLFSFTFVAGIIAFLNPCGFIMLPAYVSNHMEKTFRLQNGNMTNKQKTATFSSRKLAYALLMGLITTTGFITIFSSVGLGISYIGIRIVKIFPWIAFVSSLLVIGIGIAKLIGKTIYFNIPTYKFFSKNKSHCNSKIEYRYFFLFGIGYAIISLNCTLSLFLFVISQGITAGGIVQGFVIFLTYALGMGVMMTIISSLVSISNQKFNKIYSTKLAHNLNSITGVILIVAGIYLVYYNIVIGKLITT
ncbi:MAG TPA: cytochrome c biogenesis protein CcdA [Nitrososphaeraceae archaeon]|jgi:cytochrome c biogenesis protein CcdA